MSKCTCGPGLTYGIEIGDARRAIITSNNFIKAGHQGIYAKSRSVGYAKNNQLNGSSVVAGSYCGNLLWKIKKILYRLQLKEGEFCTHTKFVGVRSLGGHMLESLDRFSAESYAQIGQLENDFEVI